MQAYKALLTVLLMVTIWSGFGVSAFAVEKHALLIGINDYQNIPSLNKAVGDAQAMAQTMKKLGFHVTLVINPTRRDLNQAITKFRAAIQPGDTTLVHYSGHGIEINGRNFLLPADIPKPNSGEQDLIESESLSLNQVINRIASSGAAVRIFVIDACRDNPFAQEGTRSLGGTRGLAEVKTTAGTFIFYSAGFGQTALDSLGPDDKNPTSVYTRTLIDTLQKPFSHIGSIARKVRQKVEILANGIGHTQFPAYYDELSGDYCIVCEAAEIPKQANNSNDPQGGTGIPDGGAANSNVDSQSSQQAAIAAPTPDNSRQRPDLIIKSIKFEATGQCKKGRPVMNGHIIIRNIGSARAGNEESPVFIKIENTRPSLKGWGNGSGLDDIEPGQEVTAYFPLFFPSQNAGAVNGLHEFKVTIDPKKTLGESNRQNNTAYQEIAFNCPKPAMPTPQASANNNSPLAPIIPQRVVKPQNLPRGGPKSFWDHHGSLMFLKTDGNKRAFFYKNPRRILRLAGIREGSLLFYGKIAGGNYIGKMRKFSRRCGTFEFPVRGLVNRDFDAVRVIFRSDVPTRNLRTCQVTGSKPQTLIFKFLYSAKKNAFKPLNPKIKPLLFQKQRPVVRDQFYNSYQNDNNRRYRPIRKKRPIQKRPFQRNRASRHNRNR